jgi:hypothetical protein
MQRTMFAFAAAVLLSAQPVLARQHGNSGGTPKPPTHVPTTRPQPTPTSHGPSTHGNTSHSSPTTHGPTTRGTTTHGSPHASASTTGQKGHSTHTSPTTKTKTSKSSTTTAKSSNSTNHGATAKNATTSTTTTAASGSTSTTTASGTTVTLTPVQQKLQKNTNLANKLQTRLGSSTDLMTAASGFRNLGQFVAAVNVSNNLGIPFSQLKTSMVDNKLRLGQSIQALKPTANSTVEASRAEHDADVEIRATVTTTSSTATTTTAPTSTTTKKSKKTGGS